MNVQLRSVSPSWGARTPAVVLSSYQIEVTLTNHFKRLQLTSSAYLKAGMSLIGHRYSLWKYACFWPLPRGWFRLIVFDELLFSRTRSDFFIPVTIMYRLIAFLISFLPSRKKWSEFRSSLRLSNVYILSVFLCDLLIFIPLKGVDL